MVSQEYRHRIEISSDRLKSSKAGSRQCPIATAILDQHDGVKTVTVGELLETQMVDHYQIWMGSPNPFEARRTIVIYNNINSNKSSVSFVMSHRLERFVEAYDCYRTGISRDTSLIKPFTLVLDYYTHQAHMEELNESGKHHHQPRQMATHSQWSHTECQPHHLLSLN